MSVVFTQLLPRTPNHFPLPRHWTRDRDFGPAPRDPRLLVKLLFWYLNSIEPASYRWNQNRNNPQYSFQCGTTTSQLLLIFHSTQEENSILDKASSIASFRSMATKVLNLSEISMTCFFLDVFSAKFKSEHHCQCCILRCYLFVCVHRSYG